MADKMVYFDTHAHWSYPYRNKDFYENRHEYLKRAYAAGVKLIVNAPIGMESNFEMLQEFAEYPWKVSEEADALGLPRIGIAIGEHPLAAGKADPQYPDEQKDTHLAALCEEDRVCAVKTGLDYSRGIENKIRQMERFRKLIRLSMQKDLPLVLHLRGAYEDGLEVLEQEACRAPYMGVIHCFTEGPVLARKFVEKGFFLGIGGKVSYDGCERLRETVRQIPLKYLVLETDCPFIHLQGHRGESSSLDIPQIAKMVAELKGIAVEEVAKVTCKNGMKLFG